MSGTRKPIKLEPQVRVFKESSVIGTSIVSGPGQNSSASFKEIESKEAIFEANSIDEHNKGKGLLVRNLISNILVTESGMYGLHPRPYTVSVG